MNKGVLESSSPVQQMMAVPGNPSCWWNVNGIRSPPPLPVAPAAAPPTSFGSAAPSNLFLAASAASSSSSSSSSWQDINNSELPVPCSQLLLGGGLAGEDHKSGNNMSHFEDQQSQNGSSAIDHVKQENFASSNNSIYGHADTHWQDFPLASTAKPSAWSPMAPVSSFANSHTTSVETNNILDYSKNDQSARNPAKDRANKCNSNASVGAQKKTGVQPSSAQSTLKVRKEKLGDRITALQQLVSPFGKTDTASVLLEAIGYIRFLHGQIETLSLPYLGKGSGNLRHPGQGERNCVFPKDPSQNYEEEMGQRTDLRSKGLCLIPISCTLEVGSENNIRADYWTAASFEGTEREKLKASLSSYSQSHCRWCNSDGASDPIPRKESYYPRSTTYSSSSIIEATSIFCNCGAKAVKMTSYTKANPGRTFYQCPFWKNERRSCGYFEWEDLLRSSSMISEEYSLISRMKRMNISNEKLLNRLRVVCWIMILVVFMGLVIVLLVQMKWGMRMV